MNACCSPAMALVALRFIQLCVLGGVRVVSKEPRPNTKTLLSPRYWAYLSGFWRADERTRTADACSLRVIPQALQGFAGDCKGRISRGFSLLWFARFCTVLRSRWCQSGVKRSCRAKKVLRTPLCPLGSTRGRLPTGCPENRAVFAASAISYVLRADVHAQQHRCATSLRLVLDIGALLGGLFGAS